jgi:hypothetical protein
MSWTLAQLLFLKRFQTAGAVDWVDQSSRSAASWKVALGESEADAFRRFVSLGLVIQCPLPETVEYRFTAASLREMVRSRGLKRSGTKRAMANRLCAADPAGMREAIGTASVWRCAAEALKLVAEFDNRKEQMQASVLEALRARDLHRAVARVEDFDAELGFPKDPLFTMPPDWKESALIDIFDVKPAILGEIPADALRELRLAAAMDLLGCEYHLPDEIRNERLSLETKVAARMIWFRAKQIIGLRGLRAAGYQRVRLHTIAKDQVGDWKACEVCVRLSGRIWEIEDAPEIPNPDCTSSLGCRCSLLATDEPASK